MSDIYSIKLDGSEVARVSGEGITCAKRLRDRFSDQLEDDPKMLRLQREGKTILVFYVSNAENVTVEKLEEGSMITKENIENWFTYHSPTEDQQIAYREIRTAAKILAETIVKHAPSSADQTASIRLLRESVMTANASIACGGQ